MESNFVLFFQVFGESLCLTTDYLSTEEKVVAANSKVESVEAESSRLSKDLIEAMDEPTKEKGKIKELNEALKVEKLLVAQKDDEIQATLLQTNEEREKAIDQFLKSECFFDLQFIQYYKGFELLRRWMMKHHSQAVDFSNLDFEAIDTKVLVNEAKEQGEATTTAVGGEGATKGGPMDEARVDEGHMDKVVAAP